MSFIKRKKSIRFEAASFEESTSYLPNPSCGWYRIYPFVLEEKPDFEELYWCLCAEETIALVLVDIGVFREDVISEEALLNLAGILEFFQKHEKEIILRITYDREGCGMQREPEFLQTVIDHMQQLGPVIRTYQEAILIVQGLLVGSWGEMHDSKFLSEDKLKRLMHAWQEALGGIAIAVRTPQQWRLLHRDWTEPGTDNIGLFNDGMFGSSDHLGTYGWQKKKEAGWTSQWQLEEEAAFTGELAAVLPYGGEAVGESLEWSFQEMLAELRRTKVCYLNCMHDAQRLSQWKDVLCQQPGVWEQKSLFDYIGGHLGYRFVVRKAEFISKKGLYLKIWIENTGFSTLKEEAELVLCIENVESPSHKNETECLVLADSLRGAEAQEMKEITMNLPEEITASACLLSLALRRKRDKCPILFANKSLEDGRVALGQIFCK